MTTQSKTSSLKRRIEKLEDGSFNINLLPGEIVVAGPGHITPKIEVYCSEFVYNLCQGYPKIKGYTSYDHDAYHLSIPGCQEYFDWLFDKYTTDLVNRMERISQKGGRQMYHNFCHDDFKAPREFNLGRPRRVCGLFLDALRMRKSGPYYKRFGGKMLGVGFDVWGNGAFTTHFTWD